VTFSHQDVLLLFLFFFLPAHHLLRSPPLLCPNRTDPVPDHVKTIRFFNEMPHPILSFYGLCLPFSIHFDLCSPFGVPPFVHSNPYGFGPHILKVPPFIGPALLSPDLCNRPFLIVLSAQSPHRFGVCLDINWRSSLIFLSKFIELLLFPCSLKDAGTTPSLTYPPFLPVRYFSVSLCLLVLRLQSSHSLRRVPLNLAPLVFPGHLLFSPADRAFRGRSLEISLQILFAVSFTTSLTPFLPIWGPR